MIFIAIDSFCYADGKVDKIQKGMWTLRNEPNLGKMATENNNFTLRELAAGNYRVIYEVKNTDCIEIIFIHQGARDSNKRFKKL